MFELEHVAFGNQPIAEIDALDGELIAAAVDQPRAVGMDEIGVAAARGTVASPSSAERATDRPTQSHRNASSSAHARSSRPTIGDCTPRIVQTGDRLAVML